MQPLNFEPVELTDEDLRGFGLSEEEIQAWREFDAVHPMIWDTETRELARTLQVVFQEFAV